MIKRRVGFAPARGRRKAHVTCLLALCLLALLAGVALAQGGYQVARSGYQVARSGYQVARSGYQVARSGYDLSWWTVDGGGQTFSVGGNYSLAGTIGQADAGQLTGEGYRLGGGFAIGGAGGVYRVYLPVVLRGY